MTASSIDTAPILGIILEGFQARPLPTFSAPVQNVLIHLSQPSISESDLTKFVLSDPVLTHKVLKLANSKMFRAFGQKICTVSKAVKIIGAEMLFSLVSDCVVYEDSVKNKSLGHQFLKAELVKSATCGALSVEFKALSTGPSPMPEELKIAGFLSKFGAVCVSYYLPDKWEAICEAIGSGSSQDAAAVAELGMTFEELGCALCEREGIPYKELKSVLVELSAETVVFAAVGCTDILYNPHLDKEAELDAFAESLGISGTQLRAVTDQVRDNLVAALGADAVAIDEPRYPSSVEGQLNKGLVETKLKSSTLTLTETIATILEVMHESLGAARSALFLHNAKEHNFKCILSREISVKSSKYLHFSAAPGADVFSLAAKTGLVTRIVNCADRSAVKMPIWWHTHLGDASQALIIPLLWNNACIAYLYLDWAKSNSMPQVTPEVFSYLENLRELAYAKLRAVAASAKLKAAARK